MPVNTLVTQLLAQFSAQTKALHSASVEAERERAAEAAAAAAGTKAAAAAEAKDAADAARHIKAARNAVTLTAGALDAVAPGHSAPAFVISKVDDSKGTGAGASADAKGGKKKKKAKAVAAAAAGAAAADAGAAAAGSGADAKSAPKAADQKEIEKLRSEWATKGAKAKFAVSQAVGDGFYWLQLGNVYVDSFCDTVGGAAVSMVLQQAIKAYHSAETAKTNSAKGNGAMLLRRAECAVVTEQYAAAIRDYTAAGEALAKADAAARAAAGGVSSSDCAERAAAVVKHVRAVAALVKANGGLKEAKVQKLVRELPAPDKPVAARQVVWFSALAAGDNKGKALLVTVIADVSRAALHAHSGSFFPAAALDAHVTPSQYVALDGEGKVLVLSVWNAKGDVRKIVKLNDRLFVCDPQVVAVTTALPDGTTAQWSAVHADNPRLLFPGYNAWPLASVQFPLTL